MEEWKEYRLGDIIEFKTGKLNSNAAISKGKYPFFTCSPEVLSINEYAFDQKAILLAGNNAEGNFNIKYYEGKFNAYQRTYVINPTTENVDIKYLYYCLGLSLKSLKSISQGTSTKFLTATIINNLPIKLPSIRSQKQIISILSSLDNKIELNRRINENLEQQAQALFKSWFVDFEPFKDGKFVDSELGMIPEGWRVGTLEEIGQIIGGGTPSKANSSFYCENGIPWITPKDLSINKSKYISRGENDITEIGYRNSSAKKIPAGSVLFSSRAPIGYIAIANNEVTTNQGFKSVIPTKAGTCFIYLFLQLYKKYIESLATGSTFKEASGALMKSLKLKIPPQSIFENFESMLNPLFSQQCVLESEIDHLSKLRDTLLPRLMSGELQI